MFARKCTSSRAAFTSMLTAIQMAFIKVRLAHFSCFSQLGRNYVFDDRISMKINDTVVSTCNYCTNLYVLFHLFQLFTFEVWRISKMLSPWLLHRHFVLWFLPGNTKKSLFLLLAMCVFAFCNRSLILLWGEKFYNVQMTATLEELGHGQENCHESSRRSICTCQTVRNQFATVEDYYRSLKGVT